MSLIEKIASYVLSFLIALFAFFTVVCGICNYTFSNSDFMVSVLENKNYYDLIFAEYCESVESLALPAAIDEGVLSSVVSKEEFRDDIKKIVDCAYDADAGYAGNVIDYDGIYKKFYDRISQVAVDKGFMLDEELIPGIENVSGLCASTYESYITLPFIDTIGSYATDFKKYFKSGMLVGALLFLIGTIFVFVIKKWREVASKVISISFIANGFMLIIAPLVILLSGKIRYLNIEVKSLYNFAVGYIENMLFIFIVMGLISIVLGVAVVLGNYYINKKKQQKDTFDV